MMRIFRKFAILCLTIGAASAVALAQRPGEAELNQCLRNIRGNLLVKNTANVMMAGSISVTMSTDGERVLSLNCGAFQLTRDETTGRAMIAVKEGASFLPPRPLKPGEMHSLKRYLAVNPLWSLYHVLTYLDEYEISVESNGEMVFNRADSVLLSDPGEKVRGLYGERLIIDPVGGEVHEFGILMKDGEGRPLIDVVYAYEKQLDGTWKATEYSYEKIQAGVNHTVSY